MKKIVLSMMMTGAMFFAMQIHAQDGEMAVAEDTMQMEQEEFASVDVQELPQAVKDALSTDYSEASATEAWVKTKGENKVYKIKLDMDGETKKVYVDQDGNWMDMKEKDSY